MFGFDWDGDGKDGLFDDMVTLDILDDEDEDDLRGGGEPSGTCYDYLCDDDTVKAGDRVIVNGYDGEKEVRVVSVSDKDESELGLEIEKYKKIVRKV